jgi:hypothetical protein
MKQTRLSAFKDFIDAAIPVGFGSAMAGKAMSGTFGCALDFVMEHVNADTVGDAAYQYLYDAAGLLAAHNEMAGTAWGLACAALLYKSVRKAQKQAADETALLQLENGIRQALAEDFPEPAKPGLLARFLA